MRGAVKRSAWRIAPARRLVGPREPGHDRQAGGVRRRPARGPRARAAQVEDRAARRLPAPAGAARVEELVELAAAALHDEHMTVAAALHARARRDRVRALVALVAVVGEAHAARWLRARGDRDRDAVVAVAAGAEVRVQVAADADRAQVRRPSAGRPGPLETSRFQASALGNTGQPAIRGLPAAAPAGGPVAPAWGPAAIAASERAGKHRGGRDAARHAGSQPLRPRRDERVHGGVSTAVSGRPARRAAARTRPAIDSAPPAGSLARVGGPPAPRPTGRLG